MFCSSFVVSQYGMGGGVGWGGGGWGVGGAGSSLVGFFKDLFNLTGMKYLSRNYYQNYK